MDLPFVDERLHVVYLRCFTGVDCVYISPMGSCWLTRLVGQKDTRKHERNKSDCGYVVEEAMKA